jgi:hypothetical protein
MSAAAHLSGHRLRLHAPTARFARSLERTRCNRWPRHPVRAAPPAPNRSALPAFACRLRALSAPLVLLPL